MSDELISKKTRQVFREYLVGWTLREISDEFDAADVPCDMEYTPPVSGQRRSLVEQYYHGVDWTDRQDMQKVLRAYDGVLARAVERASSAFGPVSGEIKTRSRRNLIQSKRFSEMLEKAVRAYQARAIETAAVIEELIRLAKEMREAGKRGEDLGLNEEEVAFYDALEVKDSAVKVLGDETLRGIARELVESVRRNVTIDWTIKESARAKLRVLVKRILRKHGYPPDKQEKATQTVMDQAELLCKDWAA